MPLGVASIIYLSGIVRDFKPDHPDFARTSPQYARPFPNFVQNQVDANGKALFNSGVGATLVTQYVCPLSLALALSLSVCLLCMSRCVLID